MITFMNRPPSPPLQSPEEGSFSAHLILGLVDARNRLVELEERKISYPCRELYPLLTVVDPMPQSHTTSTVFPTRSPPIRPARNFPLFHTDIRYAVLSCYKFPKLHKNPSSETHRYLTLPMSLVGGHFFSFLFKLICLPSFLPYSDRFLLTHGTCRGLLRYLITLNDTHTFGRHPLEEG